MKRKFDVTGMTCSACSSRVEKTVNKLEGTTQVTVNLLTNSMQVEFDEDVIDDACTISRFFYCGNDACLKIGRAHV